MLLVMDVKSTIFSYNKPLAPCSHHVMACDDLVSPKHDQAISRAVSVHLDSNGSSLSICHVLKPERFAASCIFSLMNSLFSIVFSSLLQKNLSLKMPGFFPHLKIGCFFKHETLVSSLQLPSCTQHHSSEEENNEMQVLGFESHSTAFKRKHTGEVEYFLREFFFFLRFTKEQGKSCVLDRQ